MYRSPARHGASPSRMVRGRHPSDIGIDELDPSRIAMRGGMAMETGPDGIPLHMLRRKTHLLEYLLHFLTCLYVCMLHVCMSACQYVFMRALSQTDTITQEMEWITEADLLIVLLVTMLVVQGTPKMIILSQGVDQQ